MLSKANKGAQTGRRHGSLLELAIATVVVASRIRHQLLFAHSGRAHLKLRSGLALMEAHKFQAT
jgi:hypothetical protein